MSEPQEYARSGYWYPDGESVSTVDVLNMLRRYRSAETAIDRKSVV